MMEDIPLLAFCIPTYNRASFLKISLESYVTNEAFDGDVEIIISDNASTDETQTVGEYYASKYANIRYFRNGENIHDANFPLALDRATAHYAKLMNDNMPIATGGIRYIKECLRKHIAEKPPIFFVGVRIRPFRNDDEIVCYKFEDFVVNMSRWVTGIAQFGAWKEHWEKVENPTKYAKLQLSQDDWAYQIVEKEKQAVLLTGAFFQKKLTLPKKGGYNWFQVQVDNYYKILQTYIDKGLVSKVGVIKEKNNFVQLAMPWIAQVYWLPVFPNWDFDTKGTTKILWKHFKKTFFIYFVFFTLPIWGTLLYIKTKICMNKN